MAECDETTPTEGDPEGCASRYNGKYVTIEKLPNEILLRIFSLLSARDLLSCRAVNLSWAYIASDGFLWQTKLCQLLGTRWSVVNCERKPERPPDLSDLSLVHPCQIYVFLSKYVPKHLLSEMNTPPNSNGVSGPIHSEASTPVRLSVKESIVQWWNRVTSRFTLHMARRRNPMTLSLLRFAVFGPGFDQRATNKLFSKLVDTRTKSLEPVNMIPGRMGFGAGLTLRLYAQAQLAAYEPSIGTGSTKASVPEESAERPRKPESWQTSPRLGNRAGVRKCFPQNGTVCTQESSSTNIYRESDVPKHLQEDLIFDLHYIYSLRGHLSQRFKTQMERILSSRIFQHPSSEEPKTDADAISTLTVTETMANILRTLNGIIYALDARDDMKERFCLYSELRAVLRGLPDTIARNVPIFILYIMPKEDIKFKPFTPQVHRSSASNVNNIEMPNRDSYSGANYTVSWQGSLLLPISALKLFELDNPWRIQKCASNDIKAIIQGIMWLRERAPPLMAIPTSFPLAE